MTKFSLSSIHHRPLRKQKRLQNKGKGEHIGGSYYQHFLEDQWQREPVSWIKKDSRKQFLWKKQKVLPNFSFCASGRQHKPPRQQKRIQYMEMVKIRAEVPSKLYLITIGINNKYPGQQITPRYRKFKTRKVSAKNSTLHQKQISKTSRTTTKGYRAW